MTTVQNALWGLCLLLTVGLVANLTITRLRRVYRWFFVFLCFQLTQSLVMLPLDPDTSLYRWIYNFTQPVTWFLNILVVLELYSLALGKHPGIATLGRWALMACLFLAVGGSALTLSVDLKRLAGPDFVQAFLSIMERGVMSSLFLFLLLITASLVWFPIGVKRNIVLHAGVFSVYFLVTGMVFFVRHAVGFSELALSVVIFSVVDVCLLTWLLFLNKRGEEEVVVVRGKWRPEDEERLSEQLDSLNALLLKPPRK
jgi:hypothetical protein